MLPSYRLVNNSWIYFLQLLVRLILFCPSFGSPAENFPHLKINWWCFFHIFGAIFAARHTSPKTKQLRRGTVNAYVTNAYLYFEAYVVCVKDTHIYIYYAIIIFDKLRNEIWKLSVYSNILELILK